MRLLAALVLVIFSIQNAMAKDHAVGINENPFNVQIEQGDGINFNSRDGKLHQLIYEGQSQPFAVVTSQNSKYVNFPDKGQFIIRDASTPDSIQSIVNVAEKKSEKVDNWYADDANAHAKKVSNMDINQKIDNENNAAANAAKDTNAAKPSTDAAKPSTNAAKPSTDAKPSTNAKPSTDAKPSTNAKPSSNTKPSADSANSEATTKKTQAPKAIDSSDKADSTASKDAAKPKEDVAAHSNDSSNLVFNVALLAGTTIFALFL